jgi:hypothetical protein
MKNTKDILAYIAHYSDTTQHLSSSNASNGAGTKITTNHRHKL